MRCLELFCGTKSFRKVANNLGHEVISVDLESKFEPDILTDILEWDYTTLPRDSFDVIWASPPCVFFSRARTSAKTPPDMDLARSLVNKSFEIIEYFKPRYWFLENPVGKLRHDPVIVNRSSLINDQFWDRKTISYCRYYFSIQGNGKHRCRKDTDVFSNLRSWIPKKCCKGFYCDIKRETGRHSQTCQGATKPRKEDGVRTPGVGSLEDRYSIPPGLFVDLFNAMEEENG